jgi:hypothetical protein
MVGGWRGRVRRDERCERETGSTSVGRLVASAARASTSATDDRGGLAIDGGLERAATRTAAGVMP